MIKIVLGEVQGLRYECPKCGRGCPVREATFSLQKITVEAECAPCATVIAREFPLRVPRIGELMSLSFITGRRKEVPCETTDTAAR